MDVKWERFPLRRARKPLEVGSEHRNSDWSLDELPPMVLCSCGFHS